MSHSIEEYVRGTFWHTNNIEGYFSILKRGITGVYQSVSQQHLKRYLGEFDFRYSIHELTDMAHTVIAAKASKASASPIGGLVSGKRATRRLAKRQALPRSLARSLLRLKEERHSRRLRAVWKKDCGSAVRLFVGYLRRFQRKRRWLRNSNSCQKCRIFEGMYYDPQSNTATLGYRPAQKPDTVCQVKFSIQASRKITAWLVELLEKLTGDIEMGRRLQALQFRGDKPQERAWLTNARLHSSSASAA